MGSGGDAPAIAPEQHLHEVATYFNYLKLIGVNYIEPAYYTETDGNGEKEMTTTKKSGSPLAELEKLSKKVKRCKSCVLHETRNETVFGTGDMENAGLMFVGEAPGAEEDKQGKPFVGRAGKLLTKMIEAIGYRREEVFIANVLKCRPPGNRDPKPEEVESCEQFLIRQIELIKPVVICALGAHAAHTLLKTKIPIGRLRGSFHDYHGVPLLVTYHPAFLLRSPSFKKESWKDLQLLRDEHKKIASA